MRVAWVVGSRNVSIDGGVVAELRRGVIGAGRTLAGSSGRLGRMLVIVFNVGGGVTSGATELFEQA